MEDRRQARRRLMAEASAPDIGQKPPTPPNLNMLCKTSGGRARTTLGLPYGQLTMEKCRVIRKDPTVKFCMKFMAMPLKRVQFVVTGTDQAQIDFVQERILPVIPDYMEKAALSRDFGYNALETRYVLDEETKLIVLKQFKVLDLNRVAIVEDETGSLYCLTYQNIDGTTVDLLSLEGKFLLVTNRAAETVNRLGISDLEEAAEWFYRKRLTADMASRWTETKSDPARIVEYVSRVIATGNGVEDNGARIALDYAKKLRAGANAAVPCDEEGKPLFKITAESTPDRAPIFRNLIELWDTQMMRALLVPERALTQSQSVGSYSMAETHAQFFIQAQEDAASSFLEPFNSYILQKVLTFNFPKPDARLVIGHAGLSESDKDIIRDVLKFIMDLAAKGKPLTEAMVKKLAEMSGFPIEKDTFELPKQDTAEPVVPDSDNPDAPPDPAKKDVPPGTGKKQDATPPDASDEPGFKFHEPQRVSIAMMLAEQPGLARKLTDREAEMGERYFLSFQGDWFAAEKDITVDLVEVLGRQQAAFKQSLSGAMKLGTKKQQYDAAKQFGLKLQGQFESSLRDGMMKAAKLGKTRMWQEMKLGRVGDLAGETSSYVRSQANLSTEANMGKLLSKLRGMVQRGLQQELTEKDMLYRTDKVFEDFIESSLGGIVKVNASMALNQARREIENAGLTGEDALVSATRVSVMEPGSTCEVCEFWDGQTMELTDPGFGEFCPPAGCLGGGNCWCILLYNQEKMRPSLREVDAEPLPPDLAEKVWF